MNVLILQIFSVRRHLSTTLLLASLCCPGAFANSQFNDAYEAAQSGNYQRAFQLWTPLAAQGIASAQYALGWLYESGQGTKQSYQNAAYWYAKAADQGDVGAQFVLATMYEKGLGVPLNMAIAADWYTKAANQGDAIAQFKLGLHYQSGNGVEQSDSESFYWFEKAATQGHITAQISLGKIYQEGRGVQQDYHLAIEWYERAANQGNALAQYQLASMFELGRGTQQNLLHAKALYLQSAALYAPSAFKIGEFYERGITQAVDLQKAHQWYTRSANKGNSTAQYKLGTLYEQGIGVATNINTAIDWYVTASQQDNPQATYQLGVIYEHGISEAGQQIIAIDYYKAAKYYQKAVALEYNLAYPRLAFLYENGFGVATDRDQALALYQKSNDEFAKTRFNALNKQINCLQTATTTLFSVALACSTRKELDQHIQAQNIRPIDAKKNAWSDTYFTGAVIRGSSELKITYTDNALFASAQYTFIGRNKPMLIIQVKDLLSRKYGEPDQHSGDSQHGDASFTWYLDDGIELRAARGWPDTTTYVTYSLPEHLALLTEQQQQQQQSTKQEIQPNNIDLNLF